jgi:hypothetical protein
MGKVSPFPLSYFLKKTRRIRRNPPQNGRGRFC